MGSLEREYQSRLIGRIEQRFPGCIVLKNDEQYIQGFPDLTVLYGPHYAILEVKRSARDMLRPQPNQSYYLAQISEMGGFAAYVYPENEHEVMNALQRTFQSRR
jgi:hypothetical protein